MNGRKSIGQRVVCCSRGERLAFLVEPLDFLNFIIGENLQGWWPSVNGASPRRYLTKDPCGIR